MFTNNDVRFFLKAQNYNHAKIGFYMLEGIFVPYEIKEIQFHYSTKKKNIIIQFIGVNEFHYSWRQVETNSKLTQVYNELLKRLEQFIPIAWDYDNSQESECLSPDVVYVWRGNNG